MTAMANTMQTKKAMTTARPRQAARASKAPIKRRRGRTIGQRLTPLAVALSVGMTALAGGVALARRGAADVLPASVTVVVRPGDTIWSLAKSFGDRSAPMLDRVDTLAAANDLTPDAGLFPGQRLTVPVADADALNRMKDSGRVQSVAVAPTPAVSR